jgi:hypothetical protein
MGWNKKVKAKAKAEKVYSMKIIAEYPPNLCKNIDTHIQDEFRTPYRHNQKRTTPTTHHN